MEEKEIGIYVHIPFCKKKCYYCDFSSYPDKINSQARYVECVEQEILQYATESKIMSKYNLEPKYTIDTIYIGGGTPSIIDSNLIYQIVKCIKTNFNIKEQVEITIEVNPGTVTKEKLEKYREIGINRLSIGLQATQDDILKRIGRIHTYSQFLETYNMATEVGFDNINVDLMIALPGQTLEDVKESVKEIIELKPEHISVYSLILEEGTVLYKMVENKKMELPPDEEEREMYWYVKKKLEKHKYYQYEISNFAKYGFESKHNMNCWNQKEYIGIGAAASSFLNDARYSNTNNIEQYMKNIEDGTQNKNLILEEKLTLESKMKEYMMLGLRKIQGVNILDFERKFKINPVVKFCKELEKLNHEGLIIVIDENIQLTNKGIDFANLVWEEFI